MSFLSAINRKLGETMARFDAAEISRPVNFAFAPPPLSDQQVQRLHSPSIGGNILFDIPASVDANRAYLLEVQPINDGLFESLSPKPFSARHKTEVKPFDEVSISQNLFRRLAGANVVGKDYRKKPEVQRPLVEVSKTDGFKKAYTRRRSTSGGASYETQRLTIWELLLPTLLPPVAVNFTTQFQLYKPLFAFQPAGIEFLAKNGSALLADEMGTGKTVMSAVALKLLFRQGEVKKALIVCPVSLLRTWQDHLQDWAEELQLTVVRGTREVRALDWKYPAHVYLTTYDTIALDFLSKIDQRASFSCPKCKKKITAGKNIALEGDDAPDLFCPYCHASLNDFLEENVERRQPVVEPEAIKAFDLVLLDEAQYIKNRGSKRSRAVRLLQPKFRWALTGTPMENRIEELVSLFGFIKPGLFRNDRYYGPVEAQNAIKPHFLRRMKKDVMKDLPPKLKQEIWLELDADQQRVYRAVESSGIDHIEGLDTITKVDIFALISKLKQVCNFCPGKSSSPKTEELVDLVDGIKESGSKVLVFSQYVTEGVAKLQETLKPFGVSVLRGGMTDAARNDAISRFKNEKDIAVFLATIKTGGVGLTLTEASYVIHFDHWWNPAIMWQADDRVHRAGQKSSQVNIYSFWTQNTIEERIHAILQQKQLLFDEVINNLSEDDVNKMISTEEWLDILGIRLRPGQLIKN